MGLSEPKYGSGTLLWCKSDYIWASLHVPQRDWGAMFKLHLSIVLNIQKLTAKWSQHHDIKVVHYVKKATEIIKMWCCIQNAQCSIRICVISQDDFVLSDTSTSYQVIVTKSTDIMYNLIHKSGVICTTPMLNFHSYFQLIVNQCFLQNVCRQL
jgi:hypothetical protein